LNYFLKCFHRYNCLTNSQWNQYLKISGEIDIKTAESIKPRKKRHCNSLYARGQLYYCTEKYRQNINWGTLITPIYNRYNLYSYIGMNSNQMLIIFFLLYYAFHGSHFHFRPKLGRGPLYGQNTSIYLYYCIIYRCLSSAYAEGYSQLSHHNRL